MKQLVRYKMAFDGKCTYMSSLLMGVAFFLQAIYYFVFADLPACGTREILLNLIIPLVLEAVWFLLLRGIRINAPGLHAIVAVLICILLAVQNLFCGEMIRMVFSIAWYLLAAVVVVFVSGGFLPYRVLIVTVFFLPLCVRIFYLRQYFTAGQYWQSFPELAGTLCVAALLLFSGALVPGKKT